ncbi:UDP-N-acetylmuramoyl-L-alanine--D-glutamate ligase [Magnetospirillum sp. 64-120]|uniref:UDP-N-acetylmuramoyl-L-alanine--D-glutamate ligase n=1 Tax=Magnetospirillum sp. 64-120 TaxID=1895778 RepID=UPI00092A8716|nr:UDP-N-acetylmuramoyl-L-alanine--D-glutamate ligase [Magnetospirillum sp. 64-120]OJX71768.1 MAG: UDP-N-acetylmuramoylalanine--D-glutamate ligase [Magnetospirillum sp. 64-120]
MILVPFLADKNVMVMGLGKSGTATIRALAASGARVTAWDDNEKARAAALAEGIVLTDPAGLDVSTLDLLVWSPGIPHTHPQPHALAVAARAAGIDLVCDVELLALAKPDAQFVVISGTNGKSTTTTLCAHILKSAGIPVAAGGNLGTAALDLPDLGHDGVYVLELSSYQLELTRSLRARAGVLLNITPDHLGRHGGMDGYVAAKRRLYDLIAADGTAVIGLDDAPTRGIADWLLGAGRRHVAISVKQALDHGVSAPQGVLLEDGCEIFDLTAIQTLPGRHNWQNACAGFALARALGVEAHAIAAGIASYPGLAHRQEWVGTVNGVRYVNDSKATNAEASEVALICYDHIHWIIGGQAKEGGIASLEKYFDRIAHAYLIGDAAQAFAATLDGKVPYTQCGTLENAVQAAAARAQSGEVVLLSPACASWDQFKSFEHRGDVFRELVGGLK